MANADFEMPTLREIEIDLALGSESWQSLLATDKQSPAPAPSEHPIADPPTRSRRPFLRAAKA